MAKDEWEAADLWADRKNVHYAACPWVECCDECLVSNPLKFVYDTKTNMEVTGITGVIVGHVGDGNFHAQLMLKTDEELAKINELVRMVCRAIAYAWVITVWELARSICTKSHEKGP